ncbi:hypothetical protein HaLaN_18843 [Haematococcus lacustris]|uniref:Uncharacterized protein n=1 Tax=Haematococcus lacustris TaxID=44745 RepID=A0A699ZKD4_HAELA|nr:hypothetical protein HaLaN_18843 [Haematococcus lacustris]
MVFVQSWCAKQQLNSHLKGRSENASVAVKVQELLEEQSELTGKAHCTKQHTTMELDGGGGTVHGLVTTASRDNASRISGTHLHAFRQCAPSSKRDGSAGFGPPPVMQKPLRRASTPAMHTS